MRELSHERHGRVTHRELAGHQEQMLDLADLVRAVIDLAREHADDEIHEDGRKLLTRLAEDSFTLAIVGQFSRGKTTLTNAILGKPYLPVGAVPTTSVLTAIRYGETQRALVRRRGSRLPVETTIADVPAIVAGTSAAGDVESVEVELPADILRLGVTLVDTPGVGSATRANTATTQRFLPDADAVVFVTGFDAPLTDAETTFLTGACENVANVFVAVNKMDLVSDVEASAVLEFVAGHVERVAPELADRIFPISARRALDAELAGDDARLRASGVPALEQALVEFLTTQKSREMLVGTARRARRLVARQRFALALAGHPQASSAAEAFDARVADICDREHELLTGLRARLEDALAEHVRVELPRWREEIMAMLRPSLKHRVARASPDVAAATAARDTTEWLAGSSRVALGSWLARHADEGRRLLVEVAADDLVHLAELRGSVEAALAETLGLVPPVRASDATPIDPPPLQVGGASVIMRPAIPWRFQVAPAARVRARLEEVLDTALRSAVDEYCDELVVRFVDAAHAWIATLDATVERATRATAARLVAKLEAPANDRDKATLEDLERRLDELEIAAARAAPQGPLRNAEPVGAPSRRHVDDDCVVCQRLEHALVAYINARQYELATRTDAQAELARNAFCPLHAWDYAQTASDLGASAAYALAARETARAVDTALARSGTVEELRDAVADLAPREARCGACRVLAEEERAACAELARDGTGDHEVEALCVLHVCRVLDEGPGLERARRLVGQLGRVLQWASIDMRSYALKRRSLKRELIVQSEHSAHRRALAYLAGRSTVVHPWSVER